MGTHRYICSFFVLVQFCKLWSVSSYRVLMIPAPMKSHVACFEAIAAELGAEGHESHVVFNEQFNWPGSLNATKGVTILPYKANPNSKHDFDALIRQVAKTAIEMDATNLGEFYKTFSQSIEEETKNLFLDNEDFLVKLEQIQYDIAVVDTFFLLKFAHLLPHRLGIPVISLVDVVEPLKIRVPWLPSYVPFFAIQATEKMGFIQRVKNLISYVAWEMLNVTPFEGKEVREKYSAYGQYRDLHDLESRTMFWLVTHDSLINYPRPIMENMINVGGLTTKPARPLTGAVAEFVRDAPNGVIVMTFGSMVANLPREMIQKFMNVFSKLEQKVLWRLENEAQVNLPSNVMLSKWLPQNDLLGLPNTQLFITHCGNNGQFEALYHGVPMIGFPLFGDQFSNGIRMEYKGYGIRMNLKSFTEEELLQNIRNILLNHNHDGYHQRIQRAAKIFQSRPDTPARKAAFWVEHVIRHGAEHMRSHAMDMPLYQYLMIDVVAFILCITLLLILVVFFVLRKLLRTCFGKSNEKKKAE